ncbi:tyrosine-type recombinase/integrase [Sutcliffiella cohnii]
MLEVGFLKSFEVKLNNGLFWKDKDLLMLIEREGFKNINWEDVPLEVLIYLFLHDQPTIGEERSEKTKKEYLRDINHFLKFIFEEGISSIYSINPEHLLQYQRVIEERYKKTTLQRKSSVIKHFFRYLANKSILPEDITLQMKRPKTKMEDLINRDFYDFEVEQLLQYFQENDWFAYTLFYSLVSTGMRINELATAKWSNLRFEPSVNHYFLTVTGKGNKLRDVIIFQDVLEVLLENRRRKSLSLKIGDVDGTAFFPKASGGFYNTTYLSNEFTKLVNAAPFDFIQDRIKKEKESAEEGKNIRYRITPHTCRHYTAAFYMDKGIDSKAIQDMLGHSSIMTTERYLRRKRNLENHAGVKLRVGNFRENFSK